jgi:hypothetical protein
MAIAAIANLHRFLRNPPTRPERKLPADPETQTPTLQGMFEIDEQLRAALGEDVFAARSSERSW